MNNKAKDIKYTPIHDIHIKHKGKMTNYGGWYLPVQYTGIIEEHHAVRKAAGIFDVSHMGEIIVEGKNSEEVLQEAATNDVSILNIGQAQYTPMCLNDGGIVDDFVILKLREEQFLLVVNAVNTEKVFERIFRSAVHYSNTYAYNVSEKNALIALQGPKSQTILQGLTETNLGEIKFFRCNPDALIAKHRTIISRTGYTGEDGFEIFCDPEVAGEVWEMIVEEGKDRGLVPAGLGARDTLRLEACLPLYGNELTEETNPIEAGLLRFVKFEKPSFCGKKVLQKIKNEGPKKKLVGLEMIDRGIPRSNYPILKDGKEIGVVTSGSYSPSLKKHLGLGYVPRELSELYTEVSVKIRNREVQAKVVPMPFYKRGS